jgi:hypothetical protein
MVAITTPQPPVEQVVAVVVANPDLLDPLDLLALPVRLGRQDPKDLPVPKEFKVLTDFRDLPDLRAK